MVVQQHRKLFMSVRRLSYGASKQNWIYGLMFVVVVVAVVVVIVVLVVILIIIIIEEWHRCREQELPE